MPDSPPPPKIPSPSVRWALIPRVREFADKWQDPANVRGRNPAVLHDRARQAALLHELASALVQERENLERIGKAEMIVLAHCCQGVGDDTFTAALLAYARDVHFVERDDLQMPGGLLAAFGNR